MVAQDKDVLAQDSCGCPGPRRAGAASNAPSPCSLAVAEPRPPWRGQTLPSSATHRANTPEGSVRSAAGVGTYSTNPEQPSAGLPAHGGRGGAGTARRQDGSEVTVASVSWREPGQGGRGSPRALSSKSLHCSREQTHFGNNYSGSKGHRFPVNEPAGTVLAWGAGPRERPHTAGPLGVPRQPSSLRLCSRGR